jgi:hypothetical protein
VKIEMPNDQVIAIDPQQEVALQSAEAFLGKLKREIWRLHEAQFDGNIDDILDHGLNASITAWHLHEIVAEEFGLDKSPYRGDVKRRCIDLGLMHDIATQAKHFRVTKPQRKNLNDNLRMTTGARPYMSEEEWRESRAAFEEWGIPPIQNNDVYKSRPYHVLKVDGREVEEILEEIRRFWRYEIQRHQKEAQEDVNPSVRSL